MRKLVVAFVVLAALGLAAPPAQAGPIVSEIAFKSSVDGAVYDSAFTPWPPAGADLSGFNLATGLGTIKYVFSGAGTYYVAGFFDYFSGTAFTDETGTLHGAPGTGQSWEIDEPGFLCAFDPLNPNCAVPGFGNIYSNVSAFDSVLPLANANNIPVGGEDVSVALGYTFTLNPGDADRAVYFTVTNVAPSGFYLEQFDLETSSSVYFRLWSSDDTAPTVPEPGTMMLVGIGLAAAARRLRRR